jgi:hypothetical protein
MKTSGLDVHKDSIFCAIYDGKSYSTVKEFSMTTVSIHELGYCLESEGVKKVAMEKYVDVLGSDMGHTLGNGI